MIKKNIHYTRGYCPIPQQQRLLSIYNKTKNTRLNKIVADNPAKVFILSNLVYIATIIGLNNLEILKPNLHWKEITNIEILVILIGLNIIHIALLTKWVNFQKKAITFFTIYEETGALESQLWRKPTLTLIQDFLIVNHKVLPTLKQLIYQLGILNLYFGSIYLLTTLN